MLIMSRLSDWAGFLFFVSAVLLSTFILLFLPSYVPLSYFNLAVRASLLGCSLSPNYPMRNLQVCVRTLVHEFPIFDSDTEWNLLSSLYYNSENIRDVECY